jgi:hypothetical protein
MRLQVQKHRYLLTRSGVHSDPVDADKAANTEALLSPGAGCLRRSQSFPWPLYSPVSLKCPCATDCVLYFSGKAHHPAFVLRQLLFADGFRLLPEIRECKFGHSKILAEVVEGFVTAGQLLDLTRERWKSPSLAAIRQLPGKRSHWAIQRRRSIGRTLHRSEAIRPGTL